MAINVWSHVEAIDENFSTKFIFMLNTGFSLTIQFSRWMSGSSNFKNFGYLKGSYIDALPDTATIFWPIFTGINITVLVVGGSLIIKQKINNQNKINPVINAPKFNNVAQNKPLLNTRHAFILTFILMLIFCIHLTFPTYKMATTRAVIFQCTVFINFPIYVMFKRITFTKFIVREIQNF